MGTNSLDNLAASGVIDFDADAYIKGTEPRYVGSPEPYQGSPMDRPLLATPDAYGVQPGPQLHGSPSKDAFISKDKGHKSLELPWSKILTAGSLAALAIYTGAKIKSWAKNNTLFKSEVASGPEGFFAKAKEKISAVLKPDEASAKIKEYWGKLPTWGKITGGSLAGLLGLYGIYKATSSSPELPGPPRQEQLPQQQAHH